MSNPLLRELRPPHSDGESSDDGGSSDSDSDSDSYSDDDDDDDDDNGAPEPVQIEFEGLSERVVALPMPAGRYSCLTGLDDGRFMLVKYPIKNAGRVGLDAPYFADSDDDGGGSDSDDDDGGGGGSTGALLRFNLRQLKTSCLIDEGVRSVQLSLDRRCMVVEKVNQGCTELRVHKAGCKPDDEVRGSKECVRGGGRGGGGRMNRWMDECMDGCFVFFR